MADLTMTPSVRKTLTFFAGKVAAAYGSNLVAVVLFGSPARHKANEDSDVDVGVVLKKVDDRRAIRERLSDLAYDVLLETNVDIQAVAVTVDQWSMPETFSNPSLVRAMRRDACRSKICLVAV